MSSDGKLLVLEGVDASGKTTLCEDLHGFLIERDLPVRAFSFPGNTLGTLGELVNRIHHKHKDEFGVPHMNPCSKQILHIAAHIDLIEAKIKPLLEDGVWILLDRFWWSTYVYGLESGVSEKSLELMIQLEKEAWGEHKPDHLFLIDTEEPMRSDENDTLSWQRKRLIYKELLQSEVVEHPCSVVKTSTSADSRVQALNSILRELFPDEFL